MPMKEHKKKAWILTGCLLFILATWALFAVHDAAVASARAARAASGPAKGTCPFGNGKTEPATQEAKKKPCCGSSKKGTDQAPVEASHSKTAPPVFDREKMHELADLTDEQVEELKKQFSPEQLEKCPHLKARKTRKE